jgi:DNA polymerase I-like protein with 3'-5' exonuclease and polymerase domains
MTQRPLFDLPSPWTPTPVALLPSWKEARRVAIDLETKDETLKSLGIGVRHGGYPVGISFAIEDGPAFYLPVRHASGGNLPPSHVWDYLRDQARDFSGEIVGANLPYDLDYLAEQGVWFGNASWFRDVLIAAPLLDELQYRYDLEGVAKRAGITGKAEDGLQLAAASYGIGKVKAGLWRLPAKHVAEYAIQDVRLPLELLRLQEATIEKEGLQKVWDLESSVLPVLLKMRRRGVRIDTAKLERIEAWALREEMNALADVRRLSGVTIALGDVHRGEPLQKALDPIGVKLPLTTEGQVCTERAVLEKIDHDIPRRFLRARQVNKVRTDFVGSIKRHMVQGRIHCSFNQLKAQKGEKGTKGAAYGRLSSEHPNMQQQPARDEEIGPMWRSIYVPDEGALWAALDYSSQEPRMTVHYAVRAKCQGARAMAQRFIDNSGTDLHQATADLAGIKRKAAKEIFLGLCYGMGGAKLCKKLGYPTKKITSRYSGKLIDVAGDEGQALLNRFNELVPFVKQLAKKADVTAACRGFVRTLSGRRCRFPMKGQEYDWTYRALNRIIQGSSADQTKTAMVEAERAGYALQLQVHDELDLSVSSRKEAEAVAEIMETCVLLEVPSKVDIEIGKSWGEAK